MNSSTYNDLCFLLLQTGATPLYVAAQNGHIDCVKTLITAASNVNQALTVS